MGSIYFIAVLFISVILSICSIRVIKASELGVLPTFGKFTKNCQPGLLFIIPFMQKLELVDIKKNSTIFEWREKTGKVKTDEKIWDCFSDIEHRFRIGDQVEIADIKGISVKISPKS